MCAAEVRYTEIAAMRVFRRYNSGVPAQNTQNDVSARRERHVVYASEATGLLVIALVLLVLTLIRYWHHIHWSLR